MRPTIFFGIVVGAAVIVVVLVGCLFIRHRGGLHVCSNCKQAAVFTPLGFSNEGRREEAAAPAAATPRTQSGSLCDEAAAPAAATPRTQPRTSEPSRGLVAFTSAELETATSGFNADVLLGTGGFGSGYRASVLPPLPSARGYAVKRLAIDSMQGDEQLHTEISTLGAYRHETLLPLVGFCLEPSARCLVYPLMLGGNLEDRLLPTDGDAPHRLSQLGLASPGGAHVAATPTHHSRHRARAGLFAHAHCH